MVGFAVQHGWIHRFDEDRTNPFFAHEPAVQDCQDTEHSCDTADGAFGDNSWIGSDSG